MTVLLVLAVAAAGAVAGCLGSLLGIGGGVFLVPFLNVGLGVEFKTAAAISLMTVIATSSAVSAGSAGRHLINVRLAMVLEVASTIGGFAAGMTVQKLADNTLS
ncbi:MAG TPA: TSUP family transporter, partial [Vicinamibacterales bacterium]